MTPRAVISWSGGKDSCLALLRAAGHYTVTDMLTMFDESGTRSRSHGLSPDVIAAQAARLGLRSTAAHASWSTYTDVYAGALETLGQAGITHVIFGDVYEDAHRRWNEGVAARAGLAAVMPLWNESTETLTREFLDRGGMARLVTVRTPPLEPALLGRPLSHELVDRFIREGVDPGGERGEYHTVVTGCPLFQSSLRLTTGARVAVGECWALDVEVPA